MFTKHVCTFFFSLALCATLFVPSNQLIALQGPPGMRMNMSPEEMEQELQKMIEAMSPEERKQLEELAEVIERMSPEERRQFERELEEFAKAVEKMSPEELEALLNEGPAPAPAQPVRTEKVVSAEPVELPKEQINANKAAESLLNTIVLRIDNFLIKAESITDFALKFTKWQTEEKMVFGNKIMTWDSFKENLSTFKQKLMKLTDVDPKTKEFRYLQDLIADKQLYEQLNNLLSSLNQYEPNIIIESLSSQALSSSSKTAMRKVVEVLSKTIFIDTLSTKLDILIEKYEPAAKKIREAEEKREKQALEASKQQKRPSATTSSTASRDYRGNMSYGTDSRSGSGMPSFSGFGGGSGTPSTFGQPGQPSSQPSAGTQGASGMSDAPSTEKDTKDKKEQEERSGKHEQVSDETIKDNIKILKSELQAIAAEIALNPKLKDLANYIKKNVVDQGLIKSLNKLQEKIEKAAKTRFLIQDRIESLDEEKKEYQKKELRQTLSEHKNMLEAFETELNKIAAGFKSWGLSDDMMYAFFKDESAKNAALMPVPTPTDLGLLKESVDALMKGKLPKHLMAEEAPAKPKKETTTVGTSSNIIEQHIEKINAAFNDLLIHANNADIDNLAAYILKNQAATAIDSNHVNELIAIKTNLETLVNTIKTLAVAVDTTIPDQATEDAIWNNFNKIISDTNNSNLIKKIEHELNQISTMITSRRLSSLSAQMNHAYFGKAKPAVTTIMNGVNLGELVVLINYLTKPSSTLTESKTIPTPLSCIINHSEILKSLTIADAYANDIIAYTISKPTAVNFLDYKIAGWLAHLHQFTKEAYNSINSAQTSHATAWAGCATTNSTAFAAIKSTLTKVKTFVDNLNTPTNKAKRSTGSKIIGTIGKQIDLSTLSQLSNDLDALIKLL